MIHLQHREWVEEHTLASGSKVPVELAELQSLYPSAKSITDDNRVVDGSGNTLGRLVQTSPASDTVIGYSGSTNVLIAFGADGRVIGTRILGTRDTPEHLATVEADEAFMRQFDGLTWKELGDGTREGVDGVSGATLTSAAIVDGIMRRAGGFGAKFGKQRSQQQAAGAEGKLFEEASSIQHGLSHFRIRKESEVSRETSSSLKLPPLST